MHGISFLKIVNIEYSSKVLSDIISIPTISVLYIDIVHSDIASQGLSSPILSMTLTLIHVARPTDRGVIYYSTQPVFLEDRYRKLGVSILAFRKGTRSRYIL